MGYYFATKNTAYVVKSLQNRMIQDKINNQVNRASRLYSGSNVSNDYQFGDN